MVARVFRAALGRPARILSKEDKVMNRVLRDTLIGGALTALLAFVLIKLGWE